MKKRFALSVILLALSLVMGIMLVACGGGEDVTEITVEYKVDGGTLPSDAPTAYTVGSEPDFSKVVPTKKNYEFGGWFTDSAFTTSFSADAVKDGKVVLYAKWNAETYPLYFELDGGTCEGLPTERAFGEGVNLSAFNPTKKDFIFDGWFFSPDFTADDVVDESTISIAKRALTFYAKWLPAPTKIADIADVTKGFLIENYSVYTVDLEKYIQTNGANVVYTATSSDPTVVVTEITDGKLELDFKKNNGSSTITVKAFVDDVEYVSLQFTATPKTYTKIACIGDSLTEYANGYPAYTEHLKSILGAGYEIGNFGKSGASVTRFTNNDNYGCYREFADAQYNASLNYDGADLIIIMLGSNDATKLNEDGTPKFDWEANNIAEAYKNDYISLINEYKVKYPNADIVLMTSPEVDDENWLNTSNEILENKIYPLQLEIAKQAGVKLLDLRDYIKGIDSVSRAKLFRDNIHFSDFGAELVAKFILKNL